MNTPVLLLVYNRPKTTKLVLERLAECGVTTVYVSGDGPKNEADQVQTEAVQECLSHYTNIIQETRFENKNKGCKAAVLNGINWFFSKFEEGIILEDDCLPNQAFFKFTVEQLSLYRNERKVKMISGNNPLGKWVCGGGYFLSRIGHIWGWATWRNRWEEFDPELLQIHDFSASKGFEKAFGPTGLADYRKSLTLQSVQGKIDTWDYQWNAHILMENGLTVVPEFNRIENIGFDNNGTHTNEKPNWISNQATNETSNLKAIPLVANREYEMELSLAQRANESANESSQYYLKEGGSCSKKLTIVSINSTDIGGGAEKMAFSHHQNLLTLGHDSKLVVQVKKSDLESVIEIEPDWKSQLSVLKADVIHVHNLHGTAIELVELARYSKTIPTLFTLHDIWLCTGSSNHPFQSDPYALNFLDLKEWNSERKSRIEAIRDSNIRFTAPSQWMREQFFDTHKIRPYFVSNAVSSEPEISIGLPSNRFILFVTNRPETNPYKDFETLKSAWKKANHRLSSKQCDLVCVGAQEYRIENVGSGKLIFVSFQDFKEVLALMKASILVVQPSKLDNAPLTILEAHSVGKKVIGSLVGGIPEMLDNQEQNWLYEAEDRDGLSGKLEQAINQIDNQNLTQNPAIQASPAEMSETYLGHYLELTGG